VGIAGTKRGLVYINCFEVIENVFVVAICGKDEKKLKKLKDERKELKIFTDYNEFLKSDIDIVVVAVPLPLHAEFSIYALEKGKHVLSEVPPVNSIEEGKKLYDAVKKTRKKYMLAQNTCWWAHIRAWEKIIKDGKIGKIFYAEGEYIHNIKNYLEEEVKTKNIWRGVMPSIYYCTHSLGPLLMLMDDRCTLAQGFQVDEKYDIEGIENPASRIEVGIFKTEKGAVIKILCGFGVIREPGFHYYSIYGTKGCLETNRVGEEKTYAYFDEIPNLKHMITIPLKSGYSEIETAYTHGGTEYLLVKEFVNSILNDTEPPINVKRALEFGLPGICAHISAIKNGGVIEIPKFE
ncbi:MAG: Gfo/Idh/MocA family protein, partial [Candidatus Ratteibacteria bacterium]